MSVPVIQPSRRSDAAAPPFKTIGIVGLGLIGGSIALAARERWPSAVVIGVDNPTVLETAMRRRAVDVAGEHLDVLTEADLVILAAPVGQNRALLTELDSHVRHEAVITDTGSTKRDIIAAAASLPGRFTFLGGHPLGGAAVGGLKHARPDLFRNRPWLFTPLPEVNVGALDRLTAFVTALGSVPRVMSAAEHDHLMAFLSHVPQLTASALMHVVGDAVGEGGLALAGRGLDDTTRLSSSPADIWRDIAAANADEIGPALDALISVLQSLRSDLGGGSHLAEVFADAARWRAQLMARSTL